MGPGAAGPAGVTDPRRRVGDGDPPGPSRAAGPAAGRRRVFGRSGQGRALTAVEFGVLNHPTLILGGVHGDEPKSVHVVQKLAETLATARESTAGSDGRGVVVVPVVNPDGYERRLRRNLRGVDLNRNFPTRDWQPGRRRSRYYGGPHPASEPETRGLIRLIEHLQPRWIITVHSIGQQRYCNNYDGPAAGLARLLARRNRYPVRRSIGYATPGSLGRWAGGERRIPIATLELPSHHSSKRCWEDNRCALLAAAGWEVPTPAPGAT